MLGPTDKLDLRNGKSDTAKQNVRGKTEETQLWYEWQLITPKEEEYVYKCMCLCKSVSQ